MSEATPKLLERAHLTDSEIIEIKELIDLITQADGLAPLSEHVLIHLHHGGDEQSIHILAKNNDELIGYLHLDRTDKVTGAVIEVAVAPQHRGHHVATALVQHALSLVPDMDCRLWAHGENAAAHQLAVSLGFHQSRVLWQMRRSLLAPLPKSETVSKNDTLSDLYVRSFSPVTDSEAWLALNNSVFQQHPEQGDWTLRDLQVRMSEQWFDPEGFFVAFDAENQMVGYTWTKIHGGLHHRNHEHPEIGEIYVLGVHPDFRGNGLAQALTIRALEYLRAHQLTAAMLYVDTENQRAIELYQNLGFSQWDADVMFKRLRA